MTNILDNSLVMVVLAAFIFIPVIFVKRNNKKKKYALIQNKLEKIIFDNNFKLTQKDTVGNLLIAYTDNQKLLLLNLVDFTNEIINLEKITTIKEDISYNGKEVKNVRLVLSFNSGAQKEICLYKQFDNSEGELKKAKKTAKAWALLLASTN